MSKPKTPLPQPFQTGFVVNDMDAALKYWTEVVGAGPFFQFRSNSWEELYYNGEPIDLDSRMAIGQWGDTQIEFIEQLNDVPSPYKTFKDAGRSGLHHFGSMVDDLDALVARLEAVGKKRVYWGKTKTGVRFAYFVEDEHPGAMLEFLEHGPVIDGLMEFVKNAAKGWDGSDPIRNLG
jgi:catechol 2,3-dioxygenase-like lactoylglutathione lyase family enzyme